jgi:methionine aminopeptidase
MREAKEPEEIALLKKAVAFTAEGHRAALGAVRPGRREFEVKDAVEEGFRRAGSRHVAYASIVGSGPNSAVLHYPKDDRRMNDGEVVLIDAGAEAEYYASDSRLRGVTGLALDRCLTRDEAPLCRVEPRRILRVSFSDARTCGTALDRRHPCGAREGHPDVCRAE